MTRLIIIATLSLFGCGTTSNKPSTMRMEELLTSERSQYIKNFQLGFDQNKTDKSVIEIMLQITADQNRNQPEVFQLKRYDMVTVNAQGKFDLTEFNLPKDSVLNFDKQVYDVNTVKVEIYPFVWNGCEFTLNKKPNDSYIIWAKKWIDIDDDKKPTGDGFQNVIHSVTFPEEINGKWTTSIDFGSAPIDAFKELLEVLSKQGIDKIEIHSRTFLD